MDHYYSNEPSVESKARRFEYDLEKDLLEFKTDNGVFSKNFIDYGSRALLDTLDFPLDGKILDLGCGYGPIGIILAKRNPQSNILMADVNLRALDLCRENIKINNINNALAIASNAYENILESFDYIVTNPPIRAGKRVVFEFLEGAYKHLVNNGEIYVVIQKKQGAPSAKSKLEEVFGNCEIVNRNKGYYILKSKKSCWLLTVWVYWSIIL